MATIHDKQIVSAKIREAIEVIAIQRQLKITITEQQISAELDVTQRALQSWKVHSGIPNVIDDGIFFGLIYLVLETGKVDVLWLRDLLIATSIPMYEPISEDLLHAYLQQARFQGQPPQSEEIMIVLSRFFNLEELKGLRGLKMNGIATSLQPLIPLEPEHREYIRTSQNISVEGITLYRFIEAFFHDFLYALEHGAALRVIIVEPTPPILEMVAFRSASSTPNDVQRQRIESIIGTLARMKRISQSELIYLRTLNYLPPYGITVYNHSLDVAKSICQVRLFTFKTPTPEAPTFFASATTDNQWFQFFSDQFELMWEYSHPYPLE